MKNTLKMTLATLAFTLLGWSPRAEARAQYDDAAMSQNPIVQRWVNFRGTRRAGWKDPSFARSFIQACQGDYFRCPAAHRMLMGTPPADLGKVKQFLQDSFQLTRDRRGRWAPVVGYLAGADSLERTPLASVVYQIPGAAAVLSKWIDSPAKMDTMLCKPKRTFLYQAFFYLGAKDQLDTILRSLPGGPQCKHTDHIKALLVYLDRWTLTPAQVRTVEEFCVNQVFQPGPFYNARTSCMRYLGRIRTRHAMARQHLVRFAGAPDFDRHEATRALMNMDLRAAKAQLLQNLRRNEMKVGKLFRKGRRTIKKQITGWSVNGHAVPSALALVGIGDKYALKAVKYWLMVETGPRVGVNAGFEDVFREAVFASPKVRKAIRRDLLKAYAAATKVARTSRPVERSADQIAIALVQMGEKAGLQRVQGILDGADDSRIRWVLGAFGGEPHKAVGAGRDPIGIGYLLVGKGGLSVKDALALAATIRRKLPMWTNDITRMMALHAYYDILARVDAVKRRL